MPTSDELRLQLAVAELEERLAAAKDGDDSDELRAAKEDLRYARWVQRGGPAIEEAFIAEYERLTEKRAQLVAENPELDEHLVAPLGPHTNRHVAELYKRWLAEKG